MMITSISSIISFSLTQIFNCTSFDLFIIVLQASASQFLSTVIFTERSRHL